MTTHLDINSTFVNADKIPSSASNAPTHTPPVLHDFSIYDGIMAFPTAKTESAQSVRERIERIRLASRVF